MHLGCPDFLDATLFALVSTNNSMFGYSDDVRQSIDWLSLAQFAALDPDHFCGFYVRDLGQVPLVSACRYVFVSSMTSVTSVSTASA